MANGPTKEAIYNGRMGTPRIFSQGSSPGPERLLLAPPWEAEETLTATALEAYLKAKSPA